MRPTRRTLALALALVAVAMVVPAATGVAGEIALLPAGFLAILLLVDAALGQRRGLALAVTAPAEAFTGVGVPVTVALDGRVPRGVLGHVTVPEGFTGDGALAFMTATDSARAEIALRARRRGVWDLGPVRLSWRGPLGLVEFLPDVPARARVAVVPDIRPIRSGEIEVRVRAALQGARPDPVRGTGSDFHQLRDFVAGMDPRTIDWKHSARHRQLLGKETRAERNHQVMIMIDTGRLMREEVAGLAKLDHQINAALALAWAVVLGGDQVGLLAFDARPRLYLPPEAGRAAFAHLRSHMAGLAPAPFEANPTLAFSHLGQRLRRRGLVVVFSDFADPTTAELLVENLGLVGTRHVVLFVTLGDPSLRAIVAGRPDGLDDIARAVSAGQYLRERSLVFGRLARLGILAIEADPGRLTAGLVSAYLDIKARELI
jgi:uncharacterized protein (DUF58 family)